MDSYKKLYTAANLLIDISEEYQKGAQKDQKFISSMSWAKELCTIRLSTSRRAGHSSCIKKLISERFNKKVVLFLFNEQLIKNYKD